MAGNGGHDKSFFEAMFPPEALDGEGDRWGHSWRASQHLRLAQTGRFVEQARAGRSGLRMLDVGCGQSQLLLALAEADPTAELYGTDISDNVVAWNQSRFPQIRYAQAALPTLPFGQRRFDLICAFEVLYYLSEDEQREALAVLTSRLRPGGRLLLSGGLDHGESYFDEGRLLDAISRVATVEQVEYDHAWLYRLAEERLLGVLQRTERVGRILGSSQEPYERWRQVARPLPALVVSRARRFPLRPLAQAGLRWTGRLSRAAMAWQSPAKAAQTLGCWLRPVQGRTRIFIQAAAQDAQRAPKGRGV